jgi:flagellar biosynthesis GTPase FlhF
MFQDNDQGENDLENYFEQHFTEKKPALDIDEQATQIIQTENPHLEETVGEGPVGLSLDLLETPSVPESPARNTRTKAKAAHPQTGILSLPPKRPSEEPPNGHVGKRGRKAKENQDDEKKKREEQEQEEKRKQEEERRKQEEEEKRRQEEEKKKKEEEEKKKKEEEEKRQREEQEVISTQFTKCIEILTTMSKVRQGQYPASVIISLKKELDKTLEDIEDDDVRQAVSNNLFSIVKLTISKYNDFLWS